MGKVLSVIAGSNPLPSVVNAIRLPPHWPSIILAIAHDHDHS